VKPPEPDFQLTDRKSTQIPRLVVLISGNGSNLQAVLDAAAAGELPAQVVAVFSNRPDAYGLVRAARAGIPTMAIPSAGEPDRQAYDGILGGYVASYRPDYVVLAGWMRILSSAFLDRFPGRVINLHPALPGAFPGVRAIERAYASWARGEIDCSGVTVHLVPDEGVDSGPALGVEEIPFVPGESLEQFEGRVHAVEHRLLVDTLRKVILTYHRDTKFTKQNHLDS
jgi:formyltetrahydrofolate-dependent phosphoribosylglycinamide formyltransferase